MMMMGIAEQETGGENAEDNMLELRLSLAVAISVPSPPPQQQSAAPPPGSFVVHKHQNNHPHNQNGNQDPQQEQQQLGAALGGPNESPAKPLMQRSSSPTENHRNSPRPNLTASLKHLVSQQQQQPVKVKQSVTRIPEDLACGTSRQALEPFGVSPGPQLHRPHPPPIRSSPSLQDGVDSGGLLFPQASAVTSLSASVSLGEVGQRQQSAHPMNLTHESILQKGFPNHHQPRLSSNHRVYSRPTSADFSHQHSGGKELLTEQGQQEVGSLGRCVLSSFAPSSGRILGTGSHSTHNSMQGVTLPVTGPQLQAFLQQQSSNSVTVASHRQTQPPVSTLGKNPSAFSVVRPAISGAIPSSTGDFPPRESSGDFQVIVNVSDRKLKLTSDVDATSLYALCRRWVRNDVTRRDQFLLRDCPPLPRPLRVAETGTSNSGSAENREKEEVASVSQAELPGPIESISEDELLQHHIDHFKNVRQRFRDGRAKRIARFMPRLALLLPVNAENSRRDADQSHPLREAHTMACFDAGASPATKSFDSSLGVKV